MKRTTRNGLVCGAVLMLLVIVFLAGMIYEDNHYLHGNRAEVALRKTNLPKEYAPSFYLHGDANAFKDYYTITAFQIESRREELLRYMLVSDGWTISPVGEEDFRSFSESLWHPVLVPIPEHTVFDAWFYEETSSSDRGAEVTGALSAIGRIGYGFTFAIYDSDAGLFIFLHQFG